MFKQCSKNIKTMQHHSALPKQSTGCKMCYFTEIVTFRIDSLVSEISIKIDINFYFLYTVDIPYSGKVWQIDSL